MPVKILNGEQALAHGALAAGVKMAVGYPGSPGTETLQSVIERAEEHGVYVEWSTNEKVALEMAIGASIAGKRAMVCVKSVGANVLIDPMMALNLTPLNGGLVVVLGDDPGAYGSQNDQDSRQLASFLELPMIEPATPAEGYTMIKAAFRLSEKNGFPVIIRITRSYGQYQEEIKLTSETLPAKDRDIAREPFRFVPVPSNAVAKHRDLHDRLEQFSLSGEAPHFDSYNGKGSLGIVAAGSCFRKLSEVLPAERREALKILKLNTIYPLSKDILSRFLEGCQAILILEENAPFIENGLKTICRETDRPVKILGKTTGHLPRVGELFRWQIQEALQLFIPDFEPTARFTREKEQEEWPKKKDNCSNCNYDRITALLKDAGERLGQKPFLIGDPGCLVTVAGDLDAKFAMGSSVGVASGISKMDPGERAIAIFGDSSFFHTSIPAICNAVYNRSSILMIVLDNGSAMTTGLQPNPGMGRNARGKPAPVLSIEGIARACGVPRVRSIPFVPERDNKQLAKTFEEALQGEQLEMIIIRIH